MTLSPNSVGTNPYMAVLSKSKETTMETEEDEVDDALIDQVIEINEPKGRNVTIRAAPENIWEIADDIHQDHQEKLEKKKKKKKKKEKKKKEKNAPSRISTQKLIEKELALMIDTGIDDGEDDNEQKEDKKKLIQEYQPKHFLKNIWI